MADIDIVPKHRSRAWLWALLVIVALVILWMMMPGDRAAPRSFLEPTPESSPALARALVGGILFG